MSAHALLGASSSKMWLNCPGSARLNEKLPDTGSEYAAEGTYAHTLGQLLLEFKAGEITLSQYNKSFHLLQKDSWYSHELFEHCRAYAEYVVAQPGDALLVEQRLDYSAWVPEGFGTGDAVKVSDDLLIVTDLKYGKGVKVEAEGNTQLKFYALGAIGALQTLYDFSRVQVHIFQPRLGDPTMAEYTVDEILEWAESIRPAAQRAFDGEQTYTAGEWCRFCKGRATCRARMEQEVVQAFQVTGFDPTATVAGPETLTEEEITVWLGRADAVISFLSDLKEYAYTEARNGKKWTGYKLVEGRSNRKYTNEEEIISVLDASAVPAGYLETKLVGVTALEKLLGKKTFKELVDPYIVKAPGKPTLVPESDKRPELDSAAAAQEAFKDE